MKSSTVSLRSGCVKDLWGMLPKVPACFAVHLSAYQTWVQLNLLWCESKILEKLSARVEI